MKRYLAISLLAAVVGLIEAQAPTGTQEPLSAWYRMLHVWPYPAPEPRYATAAQARFVSEVWSARRICGPQPAARGLRSQRINQSFRVLQQTGIEVHVDQQVRLELVLQVGELTQSVEVSGQAPVINAENAGCGEVIDDQEITEMPFTHGNLQRVQHGAMGANRARQWIRAASV